MRFEKRFSKLRRVGYPPTPALKPSLAFYCLVSTVYGKLSKQEVESARRAVRRSLRRKGELQIRVFPTIPFTKKPLQARMGKGKGRIVGFLSPVYPGKVVLELSLVSEQKAKEALLLAAAKLSIPVRVASFSELFF